jgi:ABC-type transporter Mla subunit MlaD
VDRLVVDTAAVRACAEALDVLKRELNDCPAIADAGSDFVGNASVADRLNEFASNWTYHRGQIVGSLDSLSGVCRTLADSLDQIDQELARAQRGETP